MNLTLETGISAVTVFLQGILSFLSPCVLPLIPLYIGYLSGGARSVDDEGNAVYKRGRILRNTFFFVLGISFAFFLLGLGFTAAGHFFQNYQALFTRIGGIIIILFGLYQLGIFGDTLFSKERRIRFQPDTLVINPLTAWVLGFTFSFAWTPCVGPALASVLLLAASASTVLTGFFLIGIYTLGFILPFMAVGLFTGRLLEFFKQHRAVIKYTAKLGGILMLFIGLMMFTGWMNHISSYLSGVPGIESPDTADHTDASQTEGSSSDADKQIEAAGTADRADTPQTEGSSSDADKQIEAAGTADRADTPQTEGSSSDADNEIPAPDFTLTDQYGNVHTLSEYRGKTVFLNFWATWCPPCRAEMPEIQEIYEEYGENASDVIILGLAAPGIGQEGSVEDIAAFLDKNGYTYPVVMDQDGAMSYAYHISAYPTTFMIDKNGNVFGYVTGQITKDMMKSIIEQTIRGVRAD